MNDFTLNTSGAIPLAHYNAISNQTFVSTLWSDLDPFTQGYIEALFVSFRMGDIGHWTDTEARKIGFSHLAPSTLAAILKDCGEVGGYAEFFADDPGASFWLNRQRQWPAWRERRPRLIDRFPPLTPSLGDDGLVYLRELA